MKKKIIKRFLLILICLAFCGGAAVVGIDAYVTHSTADRILTAEEAAKLGGVDCIMVLGCRVKPDGSPSDMLADRLRCGLEVYMLGAAPKLLMSGDHGRTEYDEVNTMKRIAMEAGVPSSNVFMDHAGFSTYESVYRARDIFGAKKMIIITQEYHLHRALFIARKLGVEAYGVAADYHTYLGQFMRDFREILARNKDFLITIMKPEPTYLGDVIPVSGNGDLTND